MLEALRKEDAGRQAIVLQPQEAHRVYLAQFDILPTEGARVAEGQEG